MSDKSYKRYRQYKANQHQYKMDQIAFPIFMMLVIGIFTKYGHIIIPLLIVFVVYRIVNFFKRKQTSKENDIITDTTNSVTFSKQLEPPTKVDTKEDGGITMGKTPKLKSTEVGYINDNDQKNNGRSNERGTDHGQWFYYMECLRCGHKYYANGSDIWQRKCPNCQGGKP